MQQTTDPDRKVLVDAPNGKASVERFTRAADALANGYSLSIAATHAGINRVTLRKWLKWGAEGKSVEFVQFLHMCEAARARFEMSRVDIVKKAGDDGQWTAAAWWLERMIPEVYGKRAVVTHEKREMPHEWSMEIEGAVDLAGLPDRPDIPELPPVRDPIPIAASDE